MTKKEPSLAVLMPTYNVASFIEEAIKSILDQTYKDFDFLILDDGSSDNTIEIIKRYQKVDGRIKLFQNEKNEGIIESRNKLFELSDHDYIALMDSDDIAHPQRFQKQLDFLLLNPEYLLVASDIEILPYNNLKRYSEYNGKIREEMIFLNIINNPSSMFHSSIVKNYQVSYDPVYRGSSDYKFWIDAMQHSNFYIIPEVLLQYRRHGMQESTFKRERQKKNHIKVTYLQLIQLIPEIPEEIVEKILFPQFISFEEKQEVLKWYKKILARNSKELIFNQKALQFVIYIQMFDLLKYSSSAEFKCFFNYVGIKNIISNFDLSINVLKKLMNFKEYDINSPLHNAELLYEKIISSNCEDINIYGVGDISDGLMYLVKQDKKNDLSIESFFDIKAENSAYEYKGYEILPPKMIQNVKSKNIVIASYAFRIEIIDNLKKILGNEFKDFNIMSI